jgi:hypothetical protein
MNKIIQKPNKSKDLIEIDVSYLNSTNIYGLNNEENRQNDEPQEEYDQEELNKMYNIDENEVRESTFRINIQSYENKNEPEVDPEICAFWNKSLNPKKFKIKSCPFESDSEEDEEREKQEEVNDINWQIEKEQHEENEGEPGFNIDDIDEMERKQKELEEKEREAEEIRKEIEETKAAFKEKRNSDKYKIRQLERENEKLKKEIKFPQVDFKELTDLENIKPQSKSHISLMLGKDIDYLNEILNVTNIKDIKIFDVLIKLLKNKLSYIVIEDKEYIYMNKGNSKWKECTLIEAVVLMSKIFSEYLYKLKQEVEGDFAKRIINDSIQLWHLNKNVDFYWKHIKSGLDNKNHETKVDKTKKKMTPLDLTISKFIEYFISKTGFSGDEIECNLLLSYYNDFCRKYNYKTLDPAPFGKKIKDSEIESKRKKCGTFYIKIKYAKSIINQMVDC